MSAYWRVNEVRVVGDNAVFVRFMPGFFRGVFSHLSDPVKFRQVTVVGGAVTWPGELDLAPDAMHEEIKQRGGEWVGSSRGHPLASPVNRGE
ncbi:MAG: DUF2442 domain-containing protein [Nitrosomonadales bacterium]|nr:DUF2442 domain-containing protein [Nitrosomonadales bacterium]